MNYELSILIVLILILIVNLLGYLESMIYDGDTGTKQSKMYLIKRKLRKK